MDCSWPHVLHVGQVTWVSSAQAGRQLYVQVQKWLQNAQSCCPAGIFMLL
jgi:hypothetical protein